MILTPERIEEIANGSYPGIIISDDMKNSFCKEAQFGHAQFASAQWRHLQIMAAGAKMLGYSAIQISGVERPEHIETVFIKIESALKEFLSFDDWKEEYLAHWTRIEKAPFPFKYYLFDKLLSSQQPQEKLKINDFPQEHTSLVERLNYSLCSKLFKKSHRELSYDRYFSKKILVSCKSCKSCRLAFTQFICPETCPKGLANGPCGGTSPGGICEFRSSKCIYGKIFQRAVRNKETSQIEDILVKNPN
jgi:methylenetetrahydrofolate reductase (NADPH)